MNKATAFIGFLAIAGFLACQQEKEKPVIINNPAPEPVIIEQQAPPATQPAEKNSDGTSIKIGEGGVSYESKNGTKSNSVNISADSSKIEINTPR